jgi:hypothetical protein
MQRDGAEIKRICGGMTSSLSIAAKKLHIVHRVHYGIGTLNPSRERQAGMRGQRKWK